MGPVGKQLWPRTRMPLMTAALKQQLKPHVHTKGQVPDCLLNGLLDSLFSATNSARQPEGWTLMGLSSSSTRTGRSGFKF